MLFPTRERSGNRKANCESVAVGPTSTDGSPENAGPAVRISTNGENSVRASSVDRTLPSLSAFVLLQILPEFWSAALGSTAKLSGQFSRTASELQIRPTI